MQKVNLILGDCINLMRSTPNNFFDLAIVDPPYGIGADNMANGSKRGKLSTARRLKAKNRLNQGSGKLSNRVLNSSNCSWDILPPDEYFTELFRISKNQIIFGANYFNLPPTRCVIAWDKLQPWENFSQFELIYTSFDFPAKIVRISQTGGNNIEKKIHPTQKPVKLYKWLLARFASVEYNILDTHLGSGSSAIAAFDFGCEFTGIELNEDYFKATQKRFKNYTNQLKINYAND